MTDEFARDPNVIFTTDFYMGIARMREILSLVLTPKFEVSDLECLRDVIYEFCEELSNELLNYSHEMRVIHEMEILYWRRRNIFQNENIASMREFLIQQFYESLPTYPTHCINLVLVHDLHHLTPYFYLKRPAPSLQVKNSMSALLHRKSIQKDGTYYLISQKWCKTWRSTEDPSSLPPISNSVHVNISRLDALNCKERQFMYVPEWAWCHLLAWHGVPHCHLGLKRVLTEDFEDTADDMWCFLFPNTNEFRIIKVSDNLYDISPRIKRIYDIPAGKEVQFYFNQVYNEKWKLLNELIKFDKECIGNVLLVMRKDNGDWPDVEKECDYC